MEALHSRMRVVWALSAFALAAAVGAVGLALRRLLAAQFSTALPLWAVALAGGVVALVGLAVAVLRYRAWRFAVEDDALYLERGVLTRVETAVPFVRVQHIDTQRGPIARLVGLSSVVVYTAGSRGADVTIPGLAPARARDLRDRLRDLAVESEPGGAG